MQYMSTDVLLPARDAAAATYDLGLQTAGSGFLGRWETGVDGAYILLFHLISKKLQKYRKVGLLHPDRRARVKIVILRSLKMTG